MTDKFLRACSQIADTIQRNSTVSGNLSLPALYFCLSYALLLLTGWHSGQLVSSPATYHNLALRLQCANEAMLLAKICQNLDTG
jgi:hypothetical protein